DAVDLVVERRALPLPVTARLRDRLDRAEPLREGVGREAVLLQPFERLPVRAQLDAVVRADAVRPDGERAAGRDRGVFLAQRAGGRVTRVGGELLPAADEALVQLPEARDRHVDLAAHLDDPGDVFTVQ